MTEELEAPPMSGDNLPLKELKPEETKEELEKKKSKKISLKVILLIILFSILLGIGISWLIEKRRKSAVLPSPSPAEPSPSVTVLPSPTAEDLEGRINNFKKNLDEVDLKETSLNFPDLDFDIRFKAED